MKILAAGGSLTQDVLKGSLPMLVGRLAGGPYGVYLKTRQREATNAKTKEAFGWVLKHPTWRQCFTAEFMVS